MGDLEVFLTTRETAYESDPNLSTLFKLNLEELRNCEIWINDRLVFKSRAGERIK